MSNTLQPPIATLDAQASARQFFPTDLTTEQQSDADLAFRGHGFVIDTIGFLIPPTLHCEVVDDLQLCTLPGTSHWLAGMTQLRGRVLPVFDLQQLIFKRNTNTVKRQRRFLVIEHHKQGVAIILDNTPKRIELLQQYRMQHNSAVPESIASFCLNVFHHEHLWIELDFDAFFTSISQPSMRSGVSKDSLEEHP
jgi:twitching motility protein PilI